MWYFSLLARENVHTLRHYTFHLFRDSTTVTEICTPCRKFVLSKNRKPKKRTKEQQKELTWKACNLQTVLYTDLKTSLSGSTPLRRSTVQLPSRTCRTGLQVATWRSGHRWMSNCCAACSPFLSNVTLVQIEQMTAKCNEMSSQDFRNFSVIRNWQDAWIWESLRLRTSDRRTHASFVSGPFSPIELRESVLECLKLMRTDIFCCFSITRDSHWLFIWSYDTGLVETGMLATCLAVSWTWEQVVQVQTYEETAHFIRERRGFQVPLF